MQASDTTTLTEYELNNTIYKVDSIFQSTENKETLEEKIKRLILNDKDTQHTVA